MCELFDMNEPLSIKDLRSSLGLTLVEFGERIGLSSKGQVSIIERENRCGLRVALAIEALSEGRIDAATLCDEVRLARQSLHGGNDATSIDMPSPGKTGDFAVETPPVSPPPFPVPGSAGSALAPESEAA